MEKEKTQPTPKRNWNPKIDKIRHSASQKFNASHEKDIRSPVSARGGGSTFSTGENGHSVGRRDTFPRGVEEDSSGIHDESSNVPVESSEGREATDEEHDHQDQAEDEDATDVESSDEAEARGATKATKGMKLWAGSTTKWEGKAHSYEPLISPFTQPPEAEQRPSEDQDSDHDSRFQSPDPGDALSDEDRAIIKDAGSWSPSNEQNKDHDHDLLPTSSESDHSIDETSDRENQAVPDMFQKPEETGTSSQTPRSSCSKERENLDSQPQRSESGHSISDASPVHDPVEERFNAKFSTVEDAPDSPHSPVTMEDKSHGPQPTFPGSDQVKSPDTQINSPGRDRMKSLGSPPHSPEPGGANVEKSPTQDQDEENFDAEAWLNSDSPLPGNYKAIFPDTELPGHPESPRSTSSDRSSTSSSGMTSGTDSLIMSPARADEHWSSEEESYPSILRANAEIMRLLAEYKANSKLEPPPEEQEAKDKRRAKAGTDRQNERLRGEESEFSSISSISSDGSLLVSPGSPINSENSQDFVERAKKEEEEANQVALHVIELYRANFELQKDIKEKEAKFERDIKTAWTAPRPPPTTLEQRLDRIALEKIKSKEMFDEFGNQQRPVKTDPQMVVHETGIGIMITHARLNYMQKDYRSMYVYAKKAVDAASILEYGPLTARCCYYRGMASYHHGEFAVAKDDFLTSRACAGLYGISSEDIETYIEKTDKADKAEWAMFEQSPAPKADRTPATRSTVVDDGNEPSPTMADDATTLVDGSPASTEDTALPLSPFSSPAEEERWAENPHEDAKSQNHTFRRPDPLGEFPLGGDQQPGTDDIPNYQPQEEAIAEEIRKDILESKAQSLNPVSEVSPAEANPQESTTFPPPSMASTEWTLLGSATSQGTTRRVPRPYVAPITTSFPEAMSNPVGQASPDATLVSDSTDEIDEDEIMAAFGAERSGFIGAQGDEFTPVENERGVWTQNYRTDTWTRSDRTST